MFEVKKDIPIPENVGAKGSSRSRYPFQSMDVGDMFFIPNQTKNTFSAQTWKYGRRHGVKFATRMLHMKESLDGWETCEPTTKGAVQGIGVWRVK